MEIELALTRPCDHYTWDYTKKDYVCFEPQKCPACKGTCEVPSGFGEEILDFLRKHYR
jgi:hypothetical protein